MARIVHRHRLPSLAPPRGLGRLPVVGRVFLVLAAIVAVFEVWPAVNAAWAGVTDVLGEAADVLPTAFRNAAIVALPAAVRWACPSASRVNSWLWKGAVIVAIVQLVRYPAGLLQDALIEAASATGAGGESTEYLAASVISMLLAFVTTLGIWALSEGLKDAGARLGSMLILALGVAVAAVVIVVFGPSVMTAIQQGGNPLLPINLVAVLGNGLYLFALALLAGRGVSGAVLGLEPPMAWRLGAVASVSLAVLPVASVGLTFATSMLGASVPDVAYTLLRLSVFIGWPLLAVAIAMGMAAVRVRQLGPRRLRRYQLGSTARYLAPVRGTD